MWTRPVRRLAYGVRLWGSTCLMTVGSKRPWASMCGRIAAVGAPIGELLNLPMTDARIPNLQTYLLSACMCDGQPIWDRSTFCGHGSNSNQQHLQADSLAKIAGGHTSPKVNHNQFASSRQWWPLCKGRWGFLFLPPLSLGWPVHKWLGFSGSSCGFNPKVESRGPLLSEGVEFLQVFEKI